MAETPENNNEGASLRRTMRYGVWAFSSAVAFISTYLLVFVALDTDLEHYGTVYFLMTGMGIAFLLVIWLDYFLDTQIMPK